MGRLSDHLLAHTGPTAEFGPFGLPRFSVATCFSESPGSQALIREHGCIVSEEQEALTGLGSWTLAGEESCSGGVPSPLLWVHLPCPSASADKPPGSLSWHHPFQMLDI